jgi:UDP-glucose 4-epimerase
MRCLVLGGGGFIGSNLCFGLVEAGHEVSVFEKEGRDKSNLFSIEKSVRWIEGDFLNPEHLKAAVKGVDIIFHLISSTLPQSSNENPVYDVTSNVVPTLHLLDAARRAGVRKVIFFSSGGTVYGIPERVPIPEEHPTMPICSYGIHKLMVEKYLDLFHKLYSLDYAVLRVSNPYGERQRPTGSQGALTVFIYKAVKGESIEIWGDGLVVRDYLHISDVVRAAITLMTLRTDEKIFNIGSGNGLSLNDAIRCIGDALGLKLDVQYTSGRKFDVPINVLNISRAQKVLGWKPEIDLTTGVRRTAGYLRSLIGVAQKPGQ